MKGEFVKRLTRVSAFVACLGSPAFAQGDAAKGEAEFAQCKGCHMIASAEGVIVDGGKTGPNLFGVIGRVAGSFEGYYYSKAMKTAGENGLVWDEAQMAEFLRDPAAFLGGRTNMQFSTQEDGADIAAYLATFSTLPD